MRFVSGSTPEEIKLVMGIQGAVGSVQDNSIGPQTLTDLAVAVNADVFPLNVTMFNNPVIVAADIRPAAVSGSLSKYANAISGSFSWEHRPCSILISDGEVVCGTACHAHLGKPECVLYRFENGMFGIRRAKSADELPKTLRWAIGGCGLLDYYNPAAEGFTGAYADVLRRTNHTLIGVKNKMVYLCYVKNATGIECNSYAKKLGLEKAVLLDGGHIAAINGAETKINTTLTTQYYIVQGVK